MSAVCLVLVGLLAWFSASVVIAGDDAGRALMGTRAAEWALGDWLNSKPLKLADLKGRVVLVRWWTGPGCPYCSASAPALNEFDRLFRNKGLTVVGVYHHKDPLPLRVESVQRLAKQFQFEFPVAIDHKWNTLKQWWLDTGDRDFTSVSFLIDRQGVIRFIHPGGQYVKGDESYVALRAKITELLGEEVGTKPSASVSK